MGLRTRRVVVKGETNALPQHIALFGYVIGYIASEHKAASVELT